MGGRHTGRMTARTILRMSLHAARQLGAMLVLLATH